MSGPLAKAALVEYKQMSPPTPSVTVFQYNPESMVHAWTQPQTGGQGGEDSNNPLAVAGMPGESFDFTIFLDADDDLLSTVPVIKQAAQQSGVAARLAALEMLLYPVNGSTASGANPLLATVTAGSGGEPISTVPSSTVPVVLFYWNPNRIVPVRVTSLSITETLYDADLNPRHAQAQLSLRVLTPAELQGAKPVPGTATELAVTAYNQTLTTRRRWADENTAGPTGTITSKLPQR